VSGHYSPNRITRSLLWLAAFQNKGTRQFQEASWPWRQEIL